MINIRKYIASAAALFVLSTASIDAATIGYVGGYGNVNSNVSNIASDLGLTNAGNIGVATWNSNSGAALAAIYDVLVVGWTTSTTMNADWVTKVLPYLNAGGNLIWEDPNNLSELTAGGLTFGGGVSGTGIFSSVIVGLTDSGASTHNHFSISSFTSDWTKFVESAGGTTLGVFQTFASGGTMLVQGPDNFYHSSRGAPEYAFAKNMVSYSLSDSIAPVPLPASLPLLLAAFGGLAIFRRRGKAA